MDTKSRIAQGKDGALEAGGGRRPLRIAMMLESDGPGGAEIVALRLSEELRRRGHHVVPVGPRDGVGWLGERYREAGFEPETFWLNRTLDPGCVTRMMRLFRRHGIDVVHSHEFTMAVYGTAATRLLRLPHVITMHGAQNVAKVLRRRIALRWAFRNSAATVTISEDTRRQMCADFGIGSEVIGVVLNGVPDIQGDGGRIRRELCIADDETVIVAVGNLDPRKAHILLLQALQLLEGEAAECRWRVVIAGGRGGPERERLESFVETQDWAKRFNILLNRTDVADILAAADVFVMPSLWEGLPMALLEAMLAGKPVIASDVSGIPEAVRPAETGLLFPVGDVASLARALNALLTDPSRRRAMGSAGRKLGLQRFTLQVMADQYERLYFEALS